MEIPASAISWVEIPVADMARAKAFYEKVLGYELQEIDMGTFVMAMMHYDVESNGVGAALVKGEGYDPGPAGPKVYLNGGDDLQTYLDKIVPAGGTIILPKTEIGQDFGYFAAFEDSEGNIVYFHSMG